MALLGIKLRPGQPIIDQLVSAAQKAILAGTLTEGQDFPSVRALAADLKIHPNTVAKAVQHLIHEQWLEVWPGIGTVVAPTPRRSAETRRQLLRQQFADLVAEARRMGLKEEDALSSLKSEWRKAAAPVQMAK